MPSSIPAIPQHIGIIMDGNGRWAKSKNLDRIQGHTKGIDTVREITTACRELGVKHLTLYAFSEENWKRPKFEITGLMGLLKQFLQSELSLMMDQGVRLLTIGNTEKLPLIERTILDQTKKLTQNNTGMNLILALSYGGREELVRTFQKIAKDIESKKIKASDINEQLISSHLDTANIPDPDLIIRTSGEFRTSNFLPWQSTYSEYVVTQTLWPDFNKQELVACIDEYSKRERRFGLTGEQIEQQKVVA
jgi:undecaprenyl diphosphate synthase